MLIHIKGLFIKAEESLNWSFIAENNDETSTQLLSALKEGLYELKGDNNDGYIRECSNDDGSEYAEFV